MAATNRRRCLLIAGLALCCVIVAGCGSAAGGSRLSLRVVDTGRMGPQSMFQAPAMLESHPGRTLDRLKALGVAIVRLSLRWRRVAPSPSSAVRPTRFDAADPAAYPARNWSVYDAIVRGAAARGIRLDMTLKGPAPNWAMGPGEPRRAPRGAWKPIASEFGTFVRAVATRYDGSYRPSRSAAVLPRVDFWAVWNEPNYGIDLAPQAIDDSRVEVSPALYRALVDSAWSALQQTGHGRDTILIGELAPRGITAGDNPGNFSGMVPLRFIRALYCVDGSYRPLRGEPAAVRDCPTDAPSSAAFARDHPALFDASGFSIHPYPQGLAPDVATSLEPDYSDLPAIPRLERTLDAVQRAYGSYKRLAIYNTEFGYHTNPPEGIDSAISPSVAAYYLNWAEYLHYADPRIRTYDQYLLNDPESGSFATGLEFADGAPKATLAAYRMPLYLPATIAAPGQSLLVWGAVRPARYARIASGRAQEVRIEFNAQTGGPFRTIRAVTLTNPNGYFSVMQSFSQSGGLRTSWTDPDGSTFESRTVEVTVR